MEVDAAGNVPRCIWRPETPSGSARVGPDLPGPPQTWRLGCLALAPAAPRRSPAAHTQPFAFHPQWSPA